MATIDQKFKALGFRVVNTGGGVMAYERSIRPNGRSKGFQLVNVDEGGEGYKLPTRWTDPVLVGTYESSDDYGRFQSFKTVRDFFRAQEPRRNPRSTTRRPFKLQYREFNPNLGEWDRWRTQGTYASRERAKISLQSLRGEAYYSGLSDTEIQYRIIVSK